MSELKIVQDIDGDYTGPKAVVFFGIRLASFVPFDPNFESSLPKFSARPDDVWIVSFPKSGTSWLSEIVWQIMNDASISDIAINDRVYSLDTEPRILSETDPTSDRPALDARESPRILHSHLPYHVIPKAAQKEKQSKYIYLARNPKDVAVSYFHFMNRYEDGVSGFKGPFEYFLKIFLEGKAHYGLWHEHVLEWWRRRDAPNLLFLKYEDMKKDLEAEVRGLSKFLGKTLPDATVRRIADQCTMKEMQKNWTDVRSLKRLRKGQVGDWKHHFTPEMNGEIQEKMISKLKGTGLEFDFEPPSPPHRIGSFSVACREGTETLGTRFTTLIQ